MGPTSAEQAAARNEALWREVNDRIEELDDGLRVLPNDLLELHCECENAECEARVSMTPDEYREVRSQRDTFALALGHEDDAIEHIVKRTDRYLVVDKKAAVEVEVGADGIPNSGG
jgi:hypothetical protein